jgi:hypothetical protein
VFLFQPYVALASIDCMHTVLTKYDECAMCISMKILKVFYFFTSSESIYTANITTYRTAIYK